ncbi:MAG: zinc-binding dehydrogenase [Vulcanimicrobiaceae bacterium]
MQAHLMQALTYSAFGEPSEVIHLTDLPDGQPGAGEVRLRIVQAPIHNHDLATIRGRYGVRPELPSSAGSEALGVVEACGEGVTNVKVGQRVAASGIRGAWAQFAVVAAQGVVPVPEGMPDDAACQLLAMPLSALVLLDELHLPEGTWIVQTAAGGAVGRLLESIAARKNISVMNLVRREEAAQTLRNEGARHVVSTDADDWTNQVRAIVGDGKITRIVDSVAGPLALKLVRLLADRGEFVVFGALEPKPLSIDPGALIFNHIVVRGFWMSKWMQEATPQQRGAAFAELFALVQAGALDLRVSAHYPLSDAKTALIAAETPGRQGKVTFRP